MSDIVRYPNLIRLLVALAMHKGVNYADSADQILKDVTDEEMLTIFYGKPQEIMHIMRKHTIPTGLMDLIGILIDGEPTSNLVKPPKLEDIPPKKEMH